MIGIGVIGFGYWGPNLARVASQNDRARLTAISDTSPAALERASRRHRGVELHADWRDVVDHPAIDLVLVATPVDTHFEIALRALEAGKHVLVEKPVAGNVADAARLVEAAARRGLVLMVDHTLVYTPAVERIAAMIADGTVGEVYYYDSTRINLGLFQRDVNVVWDLAVHDIAILEHLTGERPVAVSATGADALGRRRQTQENIAHVTLYYAGGMTAHLNVNWLAPVKVRRTLIGGSKRMIVWDDLEPDEKIRVYDRGVTLELGPDERYERQISYRSGDMWAPRLPLAEALATELDHLLDCIETGAVPRTPGEMGLRVVEVLEAASLSLAQRGQPVEVGRIVRKAS